MKKTTIKTLFITLLILISTSVFLFFWNQNLVKNRLESKCLASDGGWAPYWTQKDCDGNLLEPESELVIDGETCWCHAPNTCWNGETCVEK